LRQRGWRGPAGGSIGASALFAITQSWLIKLSFDAPFWASKKVTGVTNRKKIVIGRRPTQSEFLFL
jgi:hypothetical protein